VNKVAPIILSLILTIAVGLGACTTASPPPPSRRAIESPPASPSNLTAEAVSYEAVKLRWIDNSGGENSFRVYRDNKLIETVPSNFTTYQDTGLKPATTYRYTVKAYNGAGESQGCSASVRTRNPPITLRLDKIGVYDNREDWTRGTDGEVYLYIVISDGKRTEQVRFPQQEGQHFKLAKNETVDIGAIIFSVDEVGDFLMVSVIGYEDDGGGFEPLVYKALGAAGLAYMTGGSGSFLEMFEYSLGGLIGTLLGAEDDFLGSFEQTWTLDSNWGVGKYLDIPLEDERGVQCLRLWFTITPSER